MPSLICTALTPFVQVVMSEENNTAFIKTLKLVICSSVTHQDT